MTVADALTSAAAELGHAGIADSRRHAALILALALGRDATFLFAHPEHNLTKRELTLFNSYLSRRKHREPFQHISGVQEFYGLEFEVSPDVLIPRPETEILVVEAIAIASALERPRFLEIGVGSGCIAISILVNVPGATAVGVDISRAALATARRNAARHDVADRLELIEADGFDAATSRFDLIVSNPPYIADQAINMLEPEVRDFEPRLALAGGESGLDLIDRIVAGAPDHLLPNGSLLIEIGHDQARRVREMFRSEIWQEIDFPKDLAGIERVVKARLR